MPTKNYYNNKDMSTKIKKENKFLDNVNVIIIVMCNFKVILLYLEIKQIIN